MAQHSIAARDPDKGRRYALRAAEWALERHAYDEAARLFALALEALEQRPPVDPHDRVELLLPAGDALVKAKHGRGQAHLPRRLRPRKDGAHHGRVIRAGCPRLLRQPWWARAGGDGRVVPLLEEALSALGRERSPLRARLLARLAEASRRTIA